MLIVPRFYHIHRRSGIRIVAARDHLYIGVKNSPQTTLGSLALAQIPQLLGSDSQPRPKNSTRLGLSATLRGQFGPRPFRPELTICHFLEKIQREPMPTNKWCLNVAPIAHLKLVNE